MSVVDVVKASAEKHLVPAAKAMAVDLVNEYIFQALEEAAKKSSTPVDDIVLAAIKEPAKAALIELINKA
jgi:hypothetical protein